MNRYMVHYPRDFSNEYEIYAGSKKQLEQLVKILETRYRSENGSSHFITRKRAVYLGRTRVNEARRDNEEWYGGFANPYGGYGETLDQEIALAVEATKQAIMEYEAAQDGWKTEREALMQESN